MEKMILFGLVLRNVMHIIYYCYKIYDCSEILLTTCFTHNIHFYMYILHIHTLARHSYIPAYKLPNG